MVTKFDISEKVYFNFPATEWGWVEKIVIIEGRTTYVVRTPDGSLTQRVETALRKSFNLCQGSTER